MQACHQEYSYMDQRCIVWIPRSFVYFGDKSGFLGQPHRISYMTSNVANRERYACQYPYDHNNAGQWHDHWNVRCQVTLVSRGLRQLASYLTKVQIYQLWFRNLLLIFRRFLHMTLFFSWLGNRNASIGWPLICRGSLKSSVLSVVYSCWVVWTV